MEYSEPATSKADIAAMAREWASAIEISSWACWSGVHGHGPAIAIATTSKGALFSTNGCDQAEATSIMNEQARRKMSERMRDNAAYMAEG